MMKRWAIIYALLMVAILLSGCGKETVLSNKKIQSDLGETWGLEPVFDYQIPIESPSILINRIGYLTNSQKIAFFSGDRVPESFVIKEKETDEIVFHGQTLRKNGKDIGEFTELQTPGTYYLCCEKIGGSFYFEIGDPIYNKLAVDWRARYESEREEFSQRMDVKDTCEMLGFLMSGYELYPNYYQESWDGEFFQVILNDINWLLTMQDSETGGVYGGTLAADGKVVGKSGQRAVFREITSEATACFVAVMAKYSYLYQQYDVDYATMCLKAAGKAWKYLEGQGIDFSMERTGAIGCHFMAAAELYRASNDSKYHWFITDYQETILNEQESVYGWLGKLTYLSTRRRVEKSLCEQMMSQFVRTAEEIAAASKQNTYWVSREDLKGLLSDMVLMSIVDYVITNHEYSTVIENHIHYILGRNLQSTDYSATLKPDEFAQLLFMIGAVTDAIEEN